MKNIEINSSELVQLFCDLVRIDSESGNEIQIRDFIEAKLKNEGIETVVDGYGNLIARLPGSGESLMLAAHLDTVKPGKGIEPVIKDGLITSAGETILGADDKAGVAAMIYCLLQLKKSNVKHRDVEAVFTREEELGCYGAVNLDYGLVRAEECLVLDHSARPGKIVLGAPTLTDINITIRGKASHASRPENGINAIVIAAKAIAKLRIGRIDKETTCNVGIINGGLISNGVPAEVAVKAEIRSHSKEKHDKWLVKFEEVFRREAQKMGGEIDFKTAGAVIGYSVDKKSPLYKKIKNTWTQLGVETLSEKIGGASDANIFNAKGIMAIPIGSGGQHAHSTQESIYVAELEDLSRFLLKFLASK